MNKVQLSVSSDTQKTRFSPLQQRLIDLMCRDQRVPEIHQNLWKHTKITRNLHKSRCQSTFITKICCSLESVPPGAIAEVETSPCGMLRSNRCYLASALGHKA